MLERWVYQFKWIYLVGTAGFEPATPCPPDKYATRLRYAPNRLLLLQQGLNYSLQAGYDEAPAKLRLQIEQKQK